MGLDWLNQAHIHLLLNHAPTIGFGVGIAIFVAAWLEQNDSLKRAGLAVMFLTAVVSIPTYLSGNFAELRLCPSGECMPGVSVSLIRAHEDTALLAFVFMEVTGFLAWLGLWQIRWTPRLPSWNATALLVLSLMTFGLMGVAANKGGDIRHSEIQAEGLAAAAAAADAGATSIAQTIGGAVSGATGIWWLWPGAETLHFIGLSLLFTAVLIVNLRVLGVARQLSAARLYQLLPLGMFGFGLNLFTGMLFFIGKPAMYMSGIFYWKILLVVLGGINVLYFTAYGKSWTVGPGEDAPPRAKLVAASTIAVWIGVLYCGHMLPFLGRSF
jgi:uncharacterized membrane protein